MRRKRTPLTFRELKVGDRFLFKSTGGTNRIGYCLKISPRKYRREANKREYAAAANDAITLPVIGRPPLKKNEKAVPTLIYLSADETRTVVGICKSLGISKSKLLRRIIERWCRVGIWAVEVKE